jgi:hypothetical protein
MMLSRALLNAGFSVRLWSISIAGRMGSPALTSVANSWLKMRKSFAVPRALPRAARFLSRLRTR